MTGSIVDIIDALATAGPQRDAAETAFEQHWATSPLVIPALLQIVADDAAKAHVRTLAAVLFRRALSKAVDVPNGAPVAMWRLLPQAEAEACKARMLQLFAQPPSSASVSLRLKIADSLAEMARLVMIADDNNNAGWPQLSAMMGDAAHDGRMVLRVLGDVPSLLAPFSGKQLQQLFERFLLHSADVEVRVAALKAFELVVDDLLSDDSDEDDSSGSRRPDERLKPLGTLVTRLDAILAPILAHNDDAIKTEALNALTELAITCPKMFREIAPALISALLPLAADAENCDEEVRAAALELALVVTEELPNVVRKNKALVAQLVHVVFKMVGEVEDDPEWYDADPEFSDPADIDPIGVLGEQAVDRVSMALGSKAVFEPLFLHLIAPALSNTNDASWKSKYAALKSIASGAEGCSDALEERLGDLLSLVWPCFAPGNHARVHFAACHALGQLCTDFSGQVQGPYCTQSLSSLLQVLQTSRVNCVQQHAAAALVNFAEGVDGATIQQFLGDLINTLVNLLQQSNGRPGLQQQLIATIAAFSSVAGEHFAQHYDTVIRLLLPCVLSEDGADLPAQSRMLQIRAVEAITLFAHAIGKAQFAASESGPVFLRRLVYLTETKFEADDWKDFLPAAWVRIAQVLSEDFLPFAPLVLSKLRVVAMQEADMAMIDADSYDPEEYPEQDWDFVERGGRRLGIRTSGLEDKYEATSSLVSIVQCVALPADIVRSLHTEVFMPLLAFDFHEGVQAAAAEGMLATALRRFPGLHAIDDCKTMMLHALKIFSSEFATSCLDALAGLLDAKVITVMELPQLVPWMEKLGKKIYEELKSDERHSSHDDHGDDCDDQDHNEFGEHEDAVYAMGRLVRVIGPALGSALAGVSEFACRATQFHSSRHASLSLLAELIKHGNVAGPAGEAAMRKALERAIKKSDDEDIQQVACYGLGLAALAAPSRLDWIVPLMSHIVGFVGGASSLSDNAVACIGRMMEACSFQPAFVQSAWPHFAKGFPVVNDLDEVAFCYRTLLKVLTANPALSQTLSPAAFTEPLTKIRDQAVLQQLDFLAQFAKQHNLL